MIPGTREDQELINKSFQVDQQKEKQKSFTETFKFAVKEKNFMAYLVAYLAQVTVMVIMLASLPYWVRFVLVAEPILEYLLFVPFLLAGILSVPFWIRFSRKYGNRIGYMCGTGLTAIFLIFTLIPFDIYGSFVCMTLIGFSKAIIGIGAFRRNRTKSSASACSFCLSLNHLAPDTARCVHGGCAIIRSHSSSGSSIT